MSLTSSSGGLLGCDAM